MCKRTTADGVWLMCLYATAGTDLRRPLRAGASADDLVQLIRTVWSQRADRGAEEHARSRGYTTLTTNVQHDAEAHRLPGQRCRVEPGLLAAWALMAWSWSAGRHPAWTLLLALPAAALYVRLFILQHDCGHGSFFASRRANRWVGAVLGLLTLFPFAYWKKTHDVHHATSGNLDRRQLGGHTSHTRQKGWPTGSA